MHCQINSRGLIMFFGNLRIRFFKISWLDCEKYQEKGTQSTKFSVQIVKITLILWPDMMWHE